MLLVWPTHWAGRLMELLFEGRFYLQERGPPLPQELHRALWDRERLSWAAVWVRGEPAIEAVLVVRPFDMTLGFEGEGPGAGGDRQWAGTADLPVPAPLAGWTALLIGLVRDREDFSVARRVDWLARLEAVEETAPARAAGPLYRLARNVEETDLLGHPMVWANMALDILQGMGVSDRDAALAAEGATPDQTLEYGDWHREAWSRTAVRGVRYGELVVEVVLVVREWDATLGYDGEGPGHSRFRIASANVTSLSKNVGLMLAQDWDLLAVQESRLRDESAELAEVEAALKEGKVRMYRGAVGPDGVCYVAFLVRRGAVTVLGSLPEGDPSRSLSVVWYVGGQTPIRVTSLYGENEGTAEIAAKVSSMVDGGLAQAEAAGGIPALVCGDLNHELGSLDVVATVVAYGWSDLGAPTPT